MAYSKTTWVNNQTKLNADNMNKIENGIETNSNNMPTDINTDSNGYLILEHDGVEITGQNKRVKIGNIDLYVHYLSIIADSKFYNGVVVSSNNTDATGTGQGLTTLFKAPADTSQQYITVSDIDHNVVGLLIWNGSIWSIQLANDNFVTVTNVTDRVEPI